MKLASGSRRLRPGSAWKRRRLPMLAEVRRGWKPVYLLWARRKRAPERVRPNSARPGSAVHSSLQVLLHFRMLMLPAAAPGSIVAPASVPTFARSSRAGGTVVPVLTLRTSVRQLEHRHSRSFAIDQTLRRERQRETVVRVRRNAGGFRRDATWAGLRLLHRAVSHANHTVRSSAPRPEAAAALSAPRHPQLKPIVLGRRSPRPASPSWPDHSSARGTEPAEPRLPRPPELVWRSRGEDRARSAGHGSLAGMAAAISASTSVAVPPVWQMSDHAVSGPMRIDPSMADRIAEDVIGRVERRMRIDRERRGV